MPDRLEIAASKGNILRQKPSSMVRKGPSDGSTHVVSAVPPQKEKLIKASSLDVVPKDQQHSVWRNFHFHLHSQEGHIFLY